MCQLYTASNLFSNYTVHIDFESFFFRSAQSCFSHLHMSVHVGVYTHTLFHIFKLQRDAFTGLQIFNIQQRTIKQQ